MRLSSKWALPTFIVAIVLGTLISMQYQVQQRVIQVKATNVARAELSRKMIKNADAEKTRLLAEQENLKKQIEDYSAQKGGVSKEMKMLIEKIGILNGRTPVEGPGIHIEIDDSGESSVYLNIADVLKDVVNVLKYAGAEAVAVNGQRIGPRASFVMSGSIPLISGVPVARIDGTHYEIEAIGEQAQLKSWVEKLYIDSLRDETSYKIPPITQKVVKIPGLRTVEDFKYATPVQP